MAIDSAKKRGGPVLNARAICGRRGSVLVLALWSLALLTAFAVSLGYMVRQKVTFLDRIEKRQDLWNAAWSGVELARATVKSDTDTEVDTLTENWANSPALFQSIALVHARVSVGYDRPSDKTMGHLWGASDEQGKLNLNTAEPAEVSLLLRQITDLNTEDADRLAFAIVDWRDTDSAYGHPDYGAEDSDYEGLQRPYEAKDLAYESLDELLLVKGMNRAIFEKMKPFVTAYGLGTVNVNTATLQVLTALGLPTTAAEKIIKHRNGTDGEPATFDDRPFLRVDAIVTDMDNDSPPMIELERTAVASLVEANKIGVTTGFFGITSRAESDNGKSSWLIEAVVNRDGNIVYCRSSGSQSSAGAGLPAGTQRVLSA